MNLDDNLTPEERAAIVTAIKEDMQTVVSHILTCDDIDSLVILFRSRHPKNGRSGDPEIYRNGFALDQLMMMVSAIGGLLIEEPLLIEPAKKMLDMIMKDILGEKSERSPPKSEKDFTLHQHKKGSF